jgi:predicted transcriptional regulator
MRRPTAAHLKLLKHAQDGDSMFGAAQQMQRTDATVEKLFYELVDANMIEHGARDEPMVLTRLGRAVLKGGVGTFKIKDI